jgi:pimeloyl-ACP methyl ester carboxylesterase
MSSLEASATEALEESNYRRDTMKQHEDYVFVSRSARRAMSRALVLGAWLAGLASVPCYAQERQGEGGHPLVIAKQGSFFAGGRSITGPGIFNPDAPTNAGEIFQIDQGYAQFEIPANARKYPLVMLHGGGQTGASWEGVPGRPDKDGYDVIFLKRGWGVYKIDAARVGRGGFPTFTSTLGNLLGQQIIPDSTQHYGLKLALFGFRLGDSWPDGGNPHFFPDTQFNATQEGLDAFNRQTVPIVPTPIDVNVEVDSVVALFDKIGPGILITHSRTGGTGWLTAIRNQNVKGVVAYEPGPAFNNQVFPDTEPGPAGSITVPLTDFLKLTKIPIQIYYGDHIPQSGGNHFQQLWRSSVINARLMADRINQHGGNANVLELPEAGLHGNTHFPFADLNNDKVADLLSQWLESNGLDKRNGE